MIVLTRKIGEAIIIGDDIDVVILGMEGNQVHIGIDAPQDMVILREELLPGDDEWADAGTAPARDHL